VAHGAGGLAALPPNEVNASLCIDSDFGLLAEECSVGGRECRDIGRRPVRDPNDAHGPVRLSRDHSSTASSIGATGPVSPPHP